MSNVRENLQSLSLAHLSAALDAGTLDARDLTEYFIDRIQSQPESQVFISTCFEAARVQAAQSAGRWRRRQPLSRWDGIPIAWKDNIDVRGCVTTVGSVAFRDAPPKAHDADVAANVHGCGLVTVGKVNLSEFAYTALGLNPHFGTPENPRSLDVPRAPGGSSSGSAVAIARGMVPVSIGTDTGGSVRTPAAFNGIVGFKPAVGRYSTSGVFPLSTTLDTVGFFVRHARDCSAMDSILRGIRPAANVTIAGNVSGLVLVVPSNIVLDDLEPEVESNFERAISKLAASGACVARRPIPQLRELQTLVQRYGALASADAYATHAARIESGEWKQIDPFVERRILAGKLMSSQDVAALRARLAHLRKSLAAELSAKEFLVMPTVPHVAPSLSCLLESEDTFARLNLLTIRNTSMGNLLDMCGLSLPNGTGKAGMPTGIAFNGLAGSEQFLLAHAAALAAVVS
uniref:amidase family protein n=1 Tax=Variovorax sp. BK018 TaxID=3450241 RepID=UPI0040391B0E